MYETQIKKHVINYGNLNTKQYYAQKTLSTSKWF